MTLKCSVCGGTDIIDDAAVVDNYYQSPVLVRCQENPEALFFKGNRKVESRARVCGDCGHVMLFVSRTGLATLRSGL